MKLGIFPKTLFVGLLAAGSLTISGFAPAADTPRKIDIQAKKFTYEPSEITVKKNEPIALELTSEDVTHGLKIKELNLNTKIEKKKTTELVFTATKVGDYVGHCSNFCGSGHGGMILTIHVTE
jgi:cytochrome c oxidase subunit II